MLALKAVIGGLSVTTFAVVGTMLEPKRFAGLLSASPAVAVASLAVIVAAIGHGQAVTSAHGMAVGALAFALACPLGAVTVRRAGAKHGVAVVWGLWLVLAAAGYRTLWP